MIPLARANGHVRPLSSAERPERPAASPRFAFEPAVPPVGAEPGDACEEPAAAVQPETPAVESAPAAEQPAEPRPRAKKRRRHALRDSQERVQDMKKLLPRKVPRLRDLQIYTAVVFDKSPQQLVAEIFGITQERVCQIVREIRAWKSTVPYDIPGMTDQQQINLATHETRQWLNRIRDKCLEKVDQTSCSEMKTYFDVSKATTHRTITERSVSPKPGFLAIALAAVKEAGKLAGAGEQWMRDRAQSPNSNIESPDEAMTNDPVPSPEPAVPSPEPAVSSQDHKLTKNSRPATVDSELPSGSLLKKKMLEFSPQNGKANGQKTSAIFRQAQVEKRRRKKIRETAYNAAADTEQIEPEYRPRFFVLLRKLDQIADRVEDRFEAQMRDDECSRPPKERKSIHYMRRRDCFETFLHASGDILTPPYGFDWVLDRYDPETGRFPWTPVDDTPPETG